MKIKEESEKTGLKPSIQNAKIMAFGPITSPQIDGETVEIVTDFIFLGCKITKDCSSENKDICSSVENPWANSDSILKSRDITLPT